MTLLAASYPQALTTRFIWRRQIRRHLYWNICCRVFPICNSFVKQNLMKEVLCCAVPFGPGQARPANSRRQPFQCAATAEPTGAQGRYSYVSECFLSVHKSANAIKQFDYPKVQTCHRLKHCRHAEAEHFAEVHRRSLLTSGLALTAAANFKSNPASAQVVSKDWEQVQLPSATLLCHIRCIFIFTPMQIFVVSSIAND